MLLVFDIGATQTRLALVSGRKVGEVVKFATDGSAGGFARFLGAVQEMTKGRRIRAMAGGLPGQLEGAKGTLVQASNLPQWLGLPVRAKLEKLMDCPVYLANDVMMNGLGEAQEGAGITKGVMAYVTVSTGVNAVRLVDGRVDESIERYEIGKQLVCGADERLVTLESLTGGAALAARRGKQPREIRDGRVWQAEERHLAAGLYNTLLHWTPELVVFGGSMMRDIDLGVVSDELDKLPQVLERLPRLERAALGDEAGLVGAAAWLKQLGH